MQKSKNSHIKLAMYLFVGALFLFVPNKVLPSTMTAQASHTALSAIAVSTKDQALQIEGPKLSSAELLAKQLSLNIPPVSAKAFLIYENENGSDVNLISSNTTEKLPIASLTKLMTAVVASENPNFEKPIQITAQDQVNVSPSLHLQTGDTVMPIDLVKSMLVGSANDAAQTLANHFPNEAAFLAAMNAKAQSLGMTDTNFTTPIGFDTPGNYSTATDLQILVNYEGSNFDYASLGRDSSYSFTSLAGNVYKIKTSNDLIPSHPDLISIKTGQTTDALGNMIVRAFGSEIQPSVIAIVLGSEDREKDTLSLVDYTLQNLSAGFSQNISESR